MSGFIYAATNYAYPNLVKIGMTERVPEIREVELGAHEGIPGRIEIKYYAFISGNARSVENSIHRRLHIAHHSKEWFEIGIDDAVKEIKYVCDRLLKYEEFFYSQNNDKFSLSCKNYLTLAKEYSEIYIPKDREKFDFILEDVIRAANNHAYILAKNEFLKKTGIDIDHCAKNPWKPGVVGKFLLSITNISVDSVQRSNERKVLDIYLSISKNDQVLIDKIEKSYTPMMSSEDYVRAKDSGNPIIYWDQKSVVKNILERNLLLSNHLNEELQKRLMNHKLS